MRFKKAHFLGPKLKRSTFLGSRTPPKKIDPGYGSASFCLKKCINTINTPLCYVSKSIILFNQFIYLFIFDNVYHGGITNTAETNGRLQTRFAIMILHTRAVDGCQTFLKASLLSILN